MTIKAIAEEKKKPTQTIPVHLECVKMKEL